MNAKQLMFVMLSASGFLMLGADQPDGGGDDGEVTEGVDGEFPGGSGGPCYIDRMRDCVKEKAKPVTCYATGQMTGSSTCTPTTAFPVSAFEKLAWSEGLTSYMTNSTRTFFLSTIECFPDGRCDHRKDRYDNIIYSEMQTCDSVIRYGDDCPVHPPA